MVDLDRDTLIELRYQISKKLFDFIVENPNVTTDFMQGFKRANDIVNSLIKRLEKGARE